MSFRAERKQLQRLNILITLLKQNRYPNSQRFVAYLRKRDLDGNENIACCPKTFQRYIKILQAEFQAPIDYDYGQRGYFLTDKSWTWRVLTLTETGVLSWVLASQAAAALFPAGMANRIADDLGEGIVANSSAALGDASLDALLLGGVTKVDVPVEVFTTVFLAWQSQRCIRFQYGSPWKGGGSQTQQRCMEPHVLGVRQDTWYALGYNRATGEERTFALHRMTEVALGDYFEVDRKLVERCQREGFYIYKTLRDVQLHCTADIAEFTRERLRDWRITPLPDCTDRFVTTIPEIQDQELIAWILNRRGKAKLVSHPEMRAQLVEIGQQLVADHGGVL